MSGGGTTDIEEEEEIVVTQAAGPLLLEKRVAVITGGSRGIGRGIAEAFAAQGAAIVISGKSQAKGEQALDEMGAGDRAMFVQTDVRQQADVNNLIDQAAKRYGGVDILVNNAGGSDRFALVHEMTDEAWQNALDFNLNAAFWGTRRALRYMLERGFGRIINIASLQSVRAFANSGPYGASKGGLMQLTRAQAEAWSAKGVNANAIAPGFFATPLTAPVAADPILWQGNAARTFIGRNGELPDLTGAAIFLASRASDYVTGQTIFVDGGFSAG